MPDHQLLRCIGRGSYGEVWLARTALGTYRAVKVVYRSDFEDARPFEREYTGIRKFEPVSRSHAGLVDVLQVGRNDGEGYFYYVMELADPGGMKNEEGRKQNEAAAPNANLVSSSSFILHPATPIAPRTLSAERRQRGRLPARECVALGVSLSGALAELHRHGLIHRDIKPSNIISSKVSRSSPILAWSRTRRSRSPTSAPRGSFRRRDRTRRRRMSSASGKFSTK